MNDRLIVRPARPDELDQVGRLTVTAYVADGHENSAGSYAAELADATRRAGDAELLVAVNASETVLGTVTVCIPGSSLAKVSRPGELEFRMLAVACNARRRGVGEVLVRAVLRRAAEIGAHRVVLCSAQGYARSAPTLCPVRVRSVARAGLGTRGRHDSAGLRHDRGVARTVRCPSPHRLRRRRRAMPRYPGDGVSGPAQ